MVIDEGMWECENVYSGKVIWLTILSTGKLRENRERRNKIYQRYGETHMETVKRDKPHQSHSLMTYPESMVTTSRKINLDFATDKAVNQGIPRLGGLWASVELYRHML